MTLFGVVNTSFCFKRTSIWTKISSIVRNELSVEKLLKFIANDLDKIIYYLVCHFYCYDYILHRTFGWKKSSLNECSFNETH